VLAPANQANYWVGRSGHEVVAIVDHIAQGSAEGTVAWFQNSASQVSAHYVVAKVGTVYKCVATTDAAWHAGVVDQPTAVLVTKTYPGINPNYYCVTPDIRALTPDLRWVPVGDLRVGDKLLAFDEHGRRDQRRHLADAVVTAVPCRRMMVYAIELADGQVLSCTGEHQWLVFHGHGHGAIWMTTEQMRDSLGVDKRRHPLSMPRYFDVVQRDSSFDGGYVSGMWDGEGTLSVAADPGEGTFQLHLAQVPNVAYERTRTVLKRHGYSFHERRRDPPGERRQPLMALTINGTRRAVFRFLMEFRPERIITQRWLGPRRKRYEMLLTTMERVPVRRVQRVGVREIVALGTSTKTFVAEGFGAHNSVGIEHEGMSGDPFPETQYAATLWLHKQILSEFPGILIDADHLIPHHAINAGHAGCPGSTFPLGRLLADLQTWAAEVHRGSSTA